jgi:predicted nucleic acid-binding protein
MNVLVDTSIWSQVLRKTSTGNPVIKQELIELIKEMRIEIIGPIRQELLSGIKTEDQYRELKQYLSAFPDLRLDTEDFEMAAYYYNQCRRSGIQGSNTDFLICSAAHHHDLAVFTADNDFCSFKKCLPIEIYSPRTIL